MQVASMKYASRIGMLCLVAASVLHAADERHARLKAWDDVFAYLDQRPSDQPVPPVSARWTEAGDTISLDAKNSAPMRLIAWTLKGGAVMYGLACANDGASCRELERTNGLEVNGVRISFAETSAGGTRVLVPRLLAAKNAWLASMRKGTSLSVESRGRWLAEFDLQQVQFAELLLKARAADAADPAKATKPAAVPGLL